MKKVILLATAALLLIGAGNALAEIGWAGNVWPNSGASVIPTSDLNTYCQVWKSGVTDGAGAGADIEAVCEVSVDGGTAVAVAVAYQGEVGSNDEYVSTIPQAMLAGAATVSVHWMFHDLTDDTWFVDTNDQAGNPAPQVYNVTNVLPNDVNVTFTICLSGAATTGDVCVIGSAAEIGTWGTGVNLSQVDGDLWAGTVTFLAGSNPSFEYKFKKDGCATWEGTANRAVTLPTDGTTDVTLAADSWEFLPMGCGMGTTLEEDKIVCMQVCMAGVEYTGGVCATGGIAELTFWGDGAAAESLGGDLYQVCLTFPAGTAIPLTVEYKFKKDDCATWESVGNRSFVVDNALAANSTFTYSWDDGPGECQTVATDETSWDALKSLYR